MSETNRLAQIIANAADKELGSRSSSDPLRHDIAAAKAIAAVYLFIRRDELPKASVVDSYGAQVIEVEGSDAGSWSVDGNAARHRKWGLEYLAAAEVMETYKASEESAKAKRRDELFLELSDDTAIHPNHKAIVRAIDRIIELEDAKG